MGICGTAFAVLDGSYAMNRFYAAYDSKGFIGLVYSTQYEDAAETAKLNGYDQYMRTETMVDYNKIYVKDGKLALRPASTARLDGLSLKGVPAGAEVIIDGIKYEADGSDITLEFPYTKVYKISVNMWPHQDWSTDLDYQAQS